MADDVVLKPVNFDPFAKGTAAARAQVEGALTPEALAADKADAESPGSKGELLREMGRKDLAPGARAILEQHYKATFGGEPPILLGNRGTQIAAERRRPKPVFPLEGEPKPAVTLKPVEGDPFAAAPAPPSNLADVGHGLKIGADIAAQDTRELVSRVPGIGPSIVSALDKVDQFVTGKPSDELLKADIESQTKASSPAQQAAGQKRWDTLDPDSAWRDWRSYTGGLAQSIPEQAVTMFPAMRLAKGAYAASIAKGLAPQVAGEAAARTATVAGAAIEGALGGAQSSRQVRDDILALKPEDLQDSEALKSLMASGLDFDQARAQLADDSATKAFFLSGVATGIFGGMGDRVLAKAMTGQLAGGAVKRAAKGAVAEGVLEELPQSALQQASQNVAMQAAVPGTEVSKDVANQALGGLALGAMQGGAQTAALGRAPAPQEPAAAPAPATPIPGAQAAPAPPASAPATQKSALSATVKTRTGLASYSYELFEQSPGEFRLRRTIKYDDGEISRHEAITDKDGNETWGQASGGNNFPRVFTSREQAMEVAREDLPDGAAMQGTAQPPLSPIDQARADAQILKSGGEIPGADETRMKNATLVSVYGENAAVRHVIESPGQFSAIGDAMLMAAPTVERVRGTIQQGQETRDITPDILGAIDEITRIRADGKSVAQVMAHGVSHDISYEGQQLAQFLDDNAGNPKRIAAFLENYLREVENATGVPSQVRGRAFDIVQEQQAARKKADEGKAVEQRKAAEQADADKLKKVRHEVGMIRAETALADLRAKAAKPEGQTAMEAAFEKAKLLKGKSNEKPRPAGHESVPARTPAHPAPGPAKGARPAARGAGALSQSAQADHSGHARSVREGGNRQGAGEVAVNRGAQIAGELTKGDGSRENPVIVSRPRHITAAAARAAEQPSAAQKNADNYAKGHFRFADSNPLSKLGVISIETAKGKERVAKDGSWSVPNMPAHYGHLQVAEGNDGDKADVTIGDDLNAKAVYVIDQIDPETKKFDETKSMVGFSSQKAAEAVYAKSFTDGQGRARIGAITEMTPAQYVARAQSNGLKSAVAYQNPEVSVPARRKGSQFLQAIRKAGGIDPKFAAEVGGDTAMQLNRRLPGLMRKGGMSEDGLLEWAQQNGYLNDAQIAEADRSGTGGGMELAKQLIRKALNDEDVHAAGDAEAAFARDEEERARNDQAYHEYKMATDPQYLAAQTAIIEPVVAELASEMAGGWATMNEEQKDAELDSIFGADSRKGPVASATEAGAGAPAAEARPSLELKGQTPSEVAAQAAQAAAQAAQAAAESVKAAVDEMRGAFTLTGSKRAADEGAARGQQDLLAEVPSQRVATTADITGDLSATLDHVLSPAEKAEAARELGDQAWSAQTTDKFLSGYADWLQQGARDLGTALSRIFAKVLAAVRNGTLAIAVAFNLNVVEHAKPLPVAITKTTVQYAIERPKADFKGVEASGEARLVADWFVRNNKQEGDPFIVADKTGGFMYAFDKDGTLLGKSPAIFGKARADILTEAQASKSVDETTDADKVTPAGIFKATPSEAYGAPSVVLKEFPESKITIHSVYLGTPSEQRLERLKSNDPASKRISYGCINALPEFIDGVIAPHFSGASQVIVVPETMDVSAFFDIKDKATEQRLATVTSTQHAEAVSWGDDKYGREERQRPSSRGTRRRQGKTPAEEPAFSRTETQVFHSELERRITDLKTNAAPAAQWKSTIKAMQGVKADEIEWSGISDWLDIQQGKVTKEAVLDYLRENGVKVEETELGGPSAEAYRLAAAKAAEANERMGDAGRAIQTFIPPTRGVDRANLPWWGLAIHDGGDEAQSSEQKARAAGLNNEQIEILRHYGAAHRAYLTAEKEREELHQGAETRYERYTIPGGENYRELLLTLPAVGTPAKAINDKLIAKYGGLSEAFKEWTPSEKAEFDAAHGATRAEQPSFSSSHFDQPNILAHVRFNERTDSEGKRVLFVEEIQSDWAQTGKSRGFRVTSEREQELRAKIKEIEGFGKNATPEQKQEWVDAMNELKPEDMYRQPPAAPFVTKTEAWVSLALKRMIRYAAENGFERVAWTNGEQQADRYDLSKQVRSIGWGAGSRLGLSGVLVDDGKRISIQFTEGRGGVALLVDEKGVVRDSAQRGEALSGKKLEDVVGKEAAEKIMASEEGALEGDGLKIGGEGMRAFYDKILPNIANDVLKKLGGGRVSETYLSPTGEAKLLANDNAANAGAIGAAPQPSFDITPKMREQAMQGLPMFSRAPAKGPFAASIEREIAPVLAKWANAPEVHVIQSMAEAPQAVRLQDNAMRSSGAAGVPEAFIYRNAVYLVADGLTPNRIYPALFHESLGHFGLRGTFGDKLNPILDRVAFDFKDRVATKAADYGLDVKTEDGRRQAAEEVLAELAQSRPHLGVVKRLIAAIRQFLRDVGLDFKLSDADLIANYIAPARNFVERGRQQAAMEAVPAFSRAAAALPSSTFSSARSVFNAATRSDRTLNRLISKFNTPFHIAETHPEFKPVYEEAQDYNQDVSRVANETADLAPDLLPRIESFSDFKKSAPSNESIAATANVLYTGTLWGGGSPLQGRVFSDAELRSGKAVTNGVSIQVFDPLNDAQIKLYRQALASVGHSLTEHAKSLVWRLAKQKGIRISAQQSLPFMATVADQLAETQIEGKRDHMRGADDETRARVQAEIAELDAFRKSMKDILDKTNGLIEHGYFPAMRFGAYAVNVQSRTLDGKWKEEYFGRFETQTAANLAKEELEKEFPAALVTSGVMNEDAHKLFQGLNLDALELFSQHMRDDEGKPISADPIMQEYFRIATTERSSLKRQIHRKGTPGFSRDVPRALAQFTVSNATSASRNYHAADMLAKVQKIKAGDLQAYATRYVRYLQDPQEESPALRGFLANYYILGSIAFGAVNMTQPLLMTAPYLTQHTSWTNAMAQLGRAAKDLVTGRKDLSEEEKGAYAKAAKAGIVSPQEIHQIRAESRASMMGDSPVWQKLESILATKGVKLPGKLLMRKAAFVWGSIYSMTEQFNRGTTFLAAYRVAKSNGDGDPYTYAKNAVDATQGVYARSNRPEVSRGNVGSIVMTFKQFNIAYLELAKRLYTHDKKAFAVLMLTLMALAGAEGLPFAEDIEDLIDTIGQWMGYPTNAKKALRKLAVDALGPDIADVLLHGASAIPGVPIDVANRMGMHNIIPGSALLKTSEPDKTRDIVDLLGPAAGLFKNVGAATEGVATGKPGELKQLLPQALQNALKAAEMVDTGTYQDTKGRKVMDVDAVDAFSKLIGFQPAKVARETRLVSQNQQDIALHKVIEDSIAGKWAHGIADKDPAAVSDALKTWAEWNKTNPEMPIAISGAQIQRRIKEIGMSREQRFIKSAPREIRGDVARDLRQ